MTNGADSVSPEIVRAVEEIARTDGGRLLSNLTGMLRDLQLAEDSLQDALESALVHWHRNGVPASPAAWIMRTAKRKAIDRLRRVANFKSKEKAIAHLIELESNSDELEEEEAIQDDRLKLIFTCCHPALDRKTAVALTLRSVCGLKTEEIAKAFLDKNDAMAQRLVRARHKISKAGIAYAVPERDHWQQRMTSVLAVIYLIFNEGYASSDVQYVRSDLCDEAIRLARLLNRLCPGEAEVEGQLALMLLHHARSSTRLGPDGEMLSLEEQNRELWDQDMISEGVALLETAQRRGQLGPYQLQAAIIARHARARTFADTNWREIVVLYDLLEQMSDNPVIALNRLAARSQIESPETVLRALDDLQEVLGDYQPFHALKADLQRRAGDREGAAVSYRRAADMAGSDAERRFLLSRLASLQN